MPKLETGAERQRRSGQRRDNVASSRVGPAVGCDWTGRGIEPSARPRQRARSALAGRIVELHLQPLIPPLETM